MITALVLINANRRRIPATAEALLTIEGVEEVFSVTGEYDLITVLRLTNHEQLAQVVTERMASIDSITQTQTMIAFRCYSRTDVEQGFNIGAD